MVTAMPGDDARKALEDSRFSDLRWVDSTGSTNADLLALAAEGAPDGVVLVADHQTAGRGRLGRTWEAPPGSSLLSSVLLRPDLPVSMLQLINLATAVAASDACDAVAGVRPMLKWPNDLIVRHDDGAERKVGGILAESSIKGDGLAAVVVGMGLNVNWPLEMPDELAAIATSLNHHAGQELDREALLVAHLRGLEALLAPLHTVEGRDALLLRYRHLSCTLGREVRIELGSGAFTGQAVDLDADGHLLVELAGDLVPVAAGDVVHLRPLS
jgi:BirA family transcriptional regulator, biotin operon repressor / biotin---[acetyl-CoA-carboxylase] ligase